MEFKLALDDVACNALDEISRTIEEVKEIIRSQGLIDWPAGRLALTLDEAAAALGIPSPTLADQLRSGRIKGAKVGRHWLLTRRQLLDALERTTI